MIGEVKGLKAKLLNLGSLIQVNNTGDTDLKRSMIKLCDYGNLCQKTRKIHDLEIVDLISFSENTIEYLNEEQKEGYLLNYIINDGISEQFDILRFSEDAVVNVELKHKIPPEGKSEILDQLMRHSFLLSVVSEKIFVFTYVREENKLYSLDSSNNLIETSFESLAKILPYDYSKINPLELVDMTKMIISPYSNSDDFKEHRYFLTSKQKPIRDSIFASDANKIGIIGGPGTGKSLVLFDLAKSYIDIGKKVLIVFCAPITDYMSISERIGISVKPIANVARDWNQLNVYDVILVDEAQRLWKDNFNHFLNLEDKKVIFSTDHQQTLHSAEINLNVENCLKEHCSVEIYKLSQKVRSNPEMASFILKLLNLRARSIQPYDYSNVRVVYFSDKETAKKFIKSAVNNENYTSIELTEYLTKTTRTLKRKKTFKLSTDVHSAIGREYDNVLVPMDEHFEYDENARLVSKYDEYYPYNESRCIFEALTRVKKELLLVIIRNPSLYKTIQEILTWKHDKEIEIFDKG